MPYLYMLKCADGSYYVGSTWDLERRFCQHSNGEGSVYMKTRRPVELVFAAEFYRIDEAFAREKQVQGWSRRKREALIESRSNELPALSKKDFTKWRPEGQ